MDQGSNALQFLRGWSFAVVQIVLLNQFPRLKFKVVFMIVTLGLRYGVLGYLDESVFNIDVIIRNILSDLFVIYVYYKSEKQEKAIFMDFFNYREELNKYKIIIENYLPQSVIVLDTQYQGPLFANKAFFRHFTSSLSDHEDEREESKPISPFIKNALNLLVPHANSFKCIGKSLSTSKTGFSPANVKNFLNDLLENRFYESSAVSFTASYELQEQQKSFEVVLIPITWDIQDAVAIVLNDITDQEKAFTLKVADKNKDLVLATMSHEFRTPLNGIIGIIQMIEPKTDRKEINELLVLCKDNATLLLTLINSVLDLQQFSHGRLKLEMSQVEIRTALNDIVRLFQFQLNQKGLFLHTKTDENIPKYIETDMNRLQQILINLIANAVKFTFQGGINLEMKEDLEDQRYLKISISDTGVGMRPKQLNTLFKIYREVGGEQLHSKHGAGLGLTISDTLVRALDNDNSVNKIEVKSEFGKGSRFTFKLLKDKRVEDEEPKRNKDEPEEDEKDEGKNDKGGSKLLRLRDSDYDIPSIGRNSLQDYEDLNENSNILNKLSKYNFKYKGSSILSNTSHIIESYHSYKDLNTPQLLSDFRMKTQKYNSDQLNKPTRNELLKKSKGHILIVDDNPFNLMIAQSFVKILDYSVVTATNGEEAIREAQSSLEAGNPIKIILMDCQMPVMDGFEASIKLREIMKKYEIPEAPIIAITANDTEEDKHRCFKSGMADHIAKPLLVQNLKKAISKFEINVCNHNDI